MRAVAQGSHFRTCHVWFEQFQSLSELDKLKDQCKGSDCIIIHGNGTKLEAGGARSSAQGSLITDLTNADGQLLELVTKTIRNEINRAERENVEVRYFGSKDLKADDTIIRSFATMYNDMYKQKGITGMELPIKELAAYIESGQLLISCAEIDGKQMVFHSYVHGNSCSRLLHSCSEFRVVDNAAKNAIGRANKYLHFKDFQHLRALGVERYDWGGVSSFMNPNGIDKFKMSFGAEPTEYFNVTVPVTFKYRLCIMMDRVLHGR